MFVYSTLTIAAIFFLGFGCDCCLWLFILSRFFWYRWIDYLSTGGLLVRIGVVVALRVSFRGLVFKLFVTFILKLVTSVVCLLCFCCFDRVGCLITKVPFHAEKICIFVL